MKRTLTAAVITISVIATMSMRVGDVAAAPDGSGTSAPRIYQPARLEDLTAIASTLKRHVAYLDVDVERVPGQPMDEVERDGFAAVLTDRSLVALSFIVERAKTIRIRGPRPGTITGRLVLYDVERRVALIEATESLSRIGLGAITVSPESGRHVEDDVFALISTAPEAGVVSGTITHTSSAEEYEGHLRIDLSLSHGMPVFDSRARWLGFARAVAWDPDPMLVVTPEIVRAARSATRAPSAAELHPEEPSRAK